MGLVLLLLQPKSYYAYRVRTGYIVSSVDSTGWLTWIAEDSILKLPLLFPQKGFIELYVPTFQEACRLHGLLLKKGVMDPDPTLKIHERCKCLAIFRNECLHSPTRMQDSICVASVLGASTW